MVFIPYMKGAIAHEGQIGRLVWRIPFWRFFRGGAMAAIYLTPKGLDDDK